MVSNILLGTNDLKKAEGFFDGVLALFGASQTMQNERSILWKTPDEKVGIAVCLPFDGEAANHGNGAMVGLTATSRDMVSAVYNKAIALGGQCEGEPGERRPGVFAAYFRDLDNNKFGIFFVDA